MKAKNKNSKSSKQSAISSSEGKNEDYRLNQVVEINSKEEANEIADSLGEKRRLELIYAFELDEETKVISRDKLWKSWMDEYDLYQEDIAENRTVIAGVIAGSWDRPRGREGTLKIFREKTNYDFLLRRSKNGRAREIEELKELEIREEK